MLVAAGPLAVAPNAPQSGGFIVAASPAIHSAKDLDGLQFKGHCCVGCERLV